METIYWIQRLGALNGFFVAMTVVFSVIFAISGVKLLTVCFDSDFDFDDEDDKKVFNKFCKALKRISVCLMVSILGLIFVPSTNDLYAIYGIGGTIDYLKSNETAKQLPDKVVDALDAWVTNLSEDDKGK